MSSVEKISIAITLEFSALIRDAVASGEYATTSEVVRDALRSWKAHRARREMRIEDVRKLWQEGLESGSGIDAGQAFDRLRSKYDPDSARDKE